MNITEIVSVSPVNPAHGRHEVHARTNENIDVGFQISPEALGCLTGYRETFTISPQTFDNFLEMFKRAEKELLNEEGS